MTTDRQVTNEQIGDSQREENEDNRIAFAPIITFSSTCEVEPSKSINGSSSLLSGDRLDMRISLLFDFRHRKIFAERSCWTSLRDTCETNTRMNGGKIKRCCSSLHSDSFFENEMYLAGRCQWSCRPSDRCYHRERKNEFSNRYRSITGVLRERVSLETKCEVASVIRSIGKRLYLCLADQRDLSFSRLIHYPLRHSPLMNFFSVCRSTERNFDWTEVLLRFVGHQWKKRFPIREHPPLSRCSRRVHR